jgi:non-ribosomal peptide synthetase component F
VYPADVATATPDKPTVILAGADGSDASQTYAELVAGANRLSRLLVDTGLRPGDHYVVLAENHLRYFEIVWAGLNAGLYVTTRARKTSARRSSGGRPRYPYLRRRDRSSQTSVKCSKSPPALAGATFACRGDLVDTGPDP